MTPLEEDLLATLREHHAEAVVPLSPSAELARLGQAEVRRRRRRTVLVAAAVLVPVLALTPWLLKQQGDADGSPAPSHSPSHLPSPTAFPTTSSPQQAQAALDALPQSVRPQVPYLVDHVLHVGDLELSTKANAMVSAAGTVLVERYSDTDATWWLLEDTRLVEVSELSGVRDPRLSPIGNLLVWTTYPDSSTTRIVAWDPQSRHEVNQVDLPIGYAACCGGGQAVELQGVDSIGNVYWEQADGSPTQVWRPSIGTAPRDLTGVGTGSQGHAPFVQVAPRGPVIDLGSSTALGEVGEDGRWTKLTTFSGSFSPALWSDGGGHYSYSGTSLRDDGPNRVEVPTVWVDDAESGSSTSIPLPAGVNVQLLGLEGSDEGSLAAIVDAWASPRKHVVLRCDTITRQCVRALTVPSGTEVQFPDGTM